MTKEYYKEYYKKYYQEHKKEINERTKKWRLENKDRFYELVYKSRKKKAEALRKQGVKNIWFSDRKRKELDERRNERLNRSNQEKEV